MQQRWPQRLWVVRHGESAGNVAREAAYAAGLGRIEIAERDVDVPLSRQGEQQSEALARWFAALPPGERPDVVLTSPYLRARRTAEIIQAGGGLPVDPADFVVDERLRDRELGVLDLLTREGVANRYPVEAQRRQWWGKFYHRPPGGESWADVALRVRFFLFEVLATPGVERVVVVAHDAVVMLARYVLEGLDEHAVLQIGATDPVRNASVTVLDRYEDVGWQLTRYNDVDHLLHSGAPVTQHGGEPDVAH